MSRAQAESVIKNIIREIVQECSAKGQAVSETLVAFMVKAVVLDPANEFSTEKTLTRDDVQKLIRICVDRLLDTRSPALDTIKMQVFFDMNYTTRRDFLEEHRRVLESRLQPVVREITDSRARTRDELESLYRKIVSCVLLRSGLGSPTDINVVREATAAMQSVFPQSELGSFLGMTKRDKERHIQELTSIVTGIRLFNKDCGKGGEGIDDLPSFLNEGIPVTTQNLEQDIKRTQDISIKYTALAEKLIEQTERPSMADSSPVSIQLLKQALINCRQHEAFLKIILSDVFRSAEQVETLLQQLATRMEQLQNTVQSKTAVPTAQVYPQFVHLAEVWAGFQDEMVLLSVLTNILNNLDAFTLGHKEIFPEEMIIGFLEDAPVKTDKERRDETTGAEHRVNPARFKDLTWLFPETTKNFDKLPIQYRGFCGWSMVAFSGLLVPANPEIGVLQFNGCYYAFASRKAACEFAEAPDEFIHAVSDAARRNPELIQFLEMHQQFASITPYGPGRDTARMIEKPITKAEAGTQTDVHFMETNIVKNYEWNEWELRRKALKLANLRTKITHSMQSDLSNYRRENYSQVYLPKEQTTQSTRDGYSNVPKPSVFYHGLRGGGMSVPTVVTKVDLTIPVQQQLLGSNNGEPSTYPAP